MSTKTYTFDLCDTLHAEYMRQIFETERYRCGNCKYFDEHDGDTEFYHCAHPRNRAKVCGSAEVYGRSLIYKSAKIYDDARVYGGKWNTSPLYIQCSG
jgi:hypothetical protein